MKRQQDCYVVEEITARDIFKRCMQEKNQLVGGEFWTDGYFASTVGKHGNESTIGNYVKNHGKTYQTIHVDHQLALF